MAFIIQRMIAPYEMKEPISDVINYLIPKGYNPLIAQAKQQFLSDLGDHTPIDQITKRDSNRPPDAYMYPRNYRIGLERLGGFLIPIQGDLFISPEGLGFVYLLLSQPETRFHVTVGDETRRTRQLELGYMGDEQEGECSKSSLV